MNEFLKSNDWRYRLLRTIVQGVIGVVGPTRMDYAAVAAKLSYIADGLSKALAGGKADALPGFGKLMIKDQN